MPEMKKLNEEGCIIKAMGGPENKHGKVNILLQAYLSNIPIKGICPCLKMGIPNSPPFYFLIQGSHWYRIKIMSHKTREEFSEVSLRSSCRRAGRYWLREYWTFARCAIYKFGTPNTRSPNSTPSPNLYVFVFSMFIWSPCSHSIQSKDSVQIASKEIDAGQIMGYECQGNRCCCGCATFGPADSQVKHKFLEVIVFILSSLQGSGPVPCFGVGCSGSAHNKDSTPYHTFGTCCLCERLLRGGRGVATYKKANNF